MGPLFSDSDSLPISNSDADNDFRLPGDLLFNGPSRVVNPEDYEDIQTVTLLTSLFEDEHLRLLMHGAIAIFFNTGNQIGFVLESERNPALRWKDIEIYLTTKDVHGFIIELHFPWKWDMNPNGLSGQIESITKLTNLTLDMAHLDGVLSILKLGEEAGVFEEPLSTFCSRPPTMTDQSLATQDGQPTKLEIKNDMKDRPIFTSSRDGHSPFTYSSFQQYIDVIGDRLGYQKGFLYAGILRKSFVMKKCKLALGGKISVHELKLALGNSYDLRKAESAYQPLYRDIDWTALRFNLPPRPTLAPILSSVSCDARERPLGVTYCDVISETVARRLETEHLGLIQRHTNVASGTGTQTI